MNERLAGACPREWLGALGEIGRFTGDVVRDVSGLRVFRFFGETLRQAGILILGSTLVIWGLVFILGLQCGIEGAYFTAAQGAPAYAGVFSAWCDLREIVPYAFGYMMAAKVGTGIVAELGAMRISDEIDALEVMGIDSVTFLCATRLLAAWIVLPFMYLAAIGVVYLASYIAVVQQIGDVSSGGYLLIFWQFQNPPDFIFSLIKGMVDGDRDRVGGLLLRLQRQRRAGGGGHRDGEVDGPEHRLRAHHRHARHAGLLGRQPASPDRRLSDDRGRADGAGAASEQRRGRRAARAPTRSRSSRARPSDEARSSASTPASIRATKRARRDRVHRRAQVVRAQPRAARPEHGPARGPGLDDHRPVGHRQDGVIKHIVGLLYPDEGDVLVHGESIPNMTDDELFELRKKFGVLFQDGALFGSMNLYDNVAFPLRQHTEKSEEEIAEIVNRRLSEVGLGGASEKMPNELSGGMRKRAGFARALVLEPEIVMFDEPDSGLDPVRTALLCELIKEVHAENGGCYLVITHDINSARRMAEYIAVLWKGRIVEVGAGAGAVRVREPVRPPVPLGRDVRARSDGVSARALAAAGVGCARRRGDAASRCWWVALALVARRRRALAWPWA